MHASLGQARYSYQLCTAISLPDISAASAALLSSCCPFQSYFSPVVLCTAGDTFLGATIHFFLFIKMFSGFLHWFVLWLNILTQSYSHHSLLTHISPLAGILQT